LRNEPTFSTIANMDEAFIGVAAIPESDGDAGKP
jgi:hypothetical protein